MKTFFVVTFYAAMVAALDLGGAVWTSLHATHPAKAATVIVTAEAPATKTVNAIPAPAPNLSDT